MTFDVEDVLSKLTNGEKAALLSGNPPSSGEKEVKE
jgi:hypothetical protein